MLVANNNKTASVRFIFNLLDMLLEHANSAVYQRYSPLGTADISPTSFSLGSGVRNLQVPPNAPTYADTIGSLTTGRRLGKRFVGGCRGHLS